MPTAESPQQTSSDEAKGLPREVSELRALGKALAILDALGGLGGRASLSEIVRRCGLAKTTVHRVLAALLAHDAVVRIGDEYLVGALLHVAASCPVDQADSLRHMVKPFMLDIYEKTRLPAALIVLADQGVVCIDLVFGHGQRDEAPPLSRPLPLHRTAAGKLFLAFDSLAAMVPPYPALFAGEASVASGALAEEITRTRHDGVARSGVDGVGVLASLAAPIWAGRGRLAAAIEVHGRAEGFPWPAVESVTRRAAYGASILLQRPGRGGYAAANRAARPRAATG